MSDKALYHREGPLVVENEATGEVELLDPIVNELDLEIEELQDQIYIEHQKDALADRKLIKTNKEKVKDIESEIKSLRNRSEKLIDLTNLIIIIQDTPQSSLYDVLMSLMSQDSPKDQKYSFVEKSGSGKLGERRNRLRGMPVLFSTQVIDDTNDSRYEEKNRRLIHVTPDTSKEKIRAAKRLIGMKYGCTNEEYDTLVVSKEDKERAKGIIKVIIAKLKQHSKYFGPKQTGIKIPFQRTIVDSIPDDRVWEMTVGERMMKYLSVITKVNMDFRPKIVNVETGAFYPISTFEDLKETLILMERGASGIRPYLAKWYNEVFLPAFKELDGNPNEDKNENGILLIREKYVGLTTELLAAKTKESMGSPKPNSNELREKYLYPLINQGVIDKARSEINNRQNIYYPVEEIDLLSSSIFDKSSSDEPKLVVKEPMIYPSKNFLEEQFRVLSKCNGENPISFEKNISPASSSIYKLIDTDGTEIPVNQLIERYFNNPEVCFSKDYEETREDYVDKSKAIGVLPAAERAIITNSQYAQEMVKKNVFSCTSQRSILAWFDNIVIEDKYNERSQSFSFKCYHCEKFQTPNEKQYEHHVLLSHPSKPAYPSNVDLERHGLNRQGKSWEI